MQASRSLLSQLGRFEILAPIGSGGMAAIYLARIAGPAGFEKPVALKVIHSHLAEDPEFIQMFLDEARIASRLQHPNIVQIYELGHAQEIYFMAMEYLPGETLSAIIQRLTKTANGLIDLRTGCHIALAACEGLHHAHEMTDVRGNPLGIVHRDVSPQNLFVTYNGSVKLMDFGIARAAGVAHSTRPGSLKGKFSYMSPEQAQGKTLDRRSDVFALGIVLWEMLAGRRLFKGKSDLESLQNVNEARVPTLSEHRAGTPEALDRVISTALSKRPDDRYQTALEMHQELSKVSAGLGQPVTTHELGARMSEWFAEEEQRKKDLLARALPADGVPRLPLAEGTSAPTMAETTPSASHASGVRVRGTGSYSGVGGVPTPSHPWVDRSAATASATPSGRFEEEPDLSYDVDFSSPRRRGRIIGVIALVLAAVAGVAAAALIYVWPLPEGADSSSESRVDFAPGGKAPGAPAESRPPLDLVQPPSGIPAPTGPAETSATSASTVRLSLAVSPSDAEVTVDGAAVEDPSSVEIPRSDDPVEVRVTAPGFLTKVLSIVPDRDVDRAVSLARRTASRPRPPAKRPEPQPGTRPTKRQDLIQNPYAPR